MSPRKGQLWFIEWMQQLGYRSNLGGICFGAACNVMHAILAEDTKKFSYYNHRLYDAHFLISEAKKEIRDRMKQEGKNEPYNESDRERVLELFQTRLRSKLKKFLGEKEYFDICAYLDGVELSFQPELYPDVFEKNIGPIFQNAILTAPLVVPKILEDKGGVVGIKAFSGVYTQESLKVYLETLRQTLEKNSYDEPISIILCSGNHAITIGYPPWVFADANDYPDIDKINTDDVEKMADKIIKAFSSNGIAVLQSRLYGTKAKEKLLERCVAEWHSTAQMHGIHQVSNQSLTQMDSYGANLLYVTTKTDDLERLKDLLKAGANPNQACKNGSAPLHVTAYRQNAALMEELLKHGANPNALGPEKVTPLHLAAHYGNLACVKLLIHYGSDLAGIAKGKTPLESAKNQGHQAIIDYMTERLQNLKSLKKEISQIKEDKTRGFRNDALNRLKKIALEAKNDIMLEKQFMDLKGIDLLLEKINHFIETNVDVSKKNTLLLVKKDILKLYNSLYKSSQHEIKFKSSLAEFKSMILNLEQPIKSPGMLGTFPAQSDVKLETEAVLKKDVKPKFGG